MNILLIDTSTCYCSAALAVGNDCISTVRYLPRKHNKFIINIINDLFIKAGIEKNDVDLLAYGVGPGSFTGIRLAASVMHAISLVTNKHVFGFSSLQAIAMFVYKTIFKSSLITVVLRAQSKYIYIGQYTFDNYCLSKIVFEKHLSIKHLKNFLMSTKYGILVGNIIEDINISFDVTKFYPDSKNMVPEVRNNYYNTLKKKKVITNAMPKYLHSLFEKK